jgi:hypothetical protein
MRRVEASLENFGFNPAGILGACSRARLLVDVLTQMANPDGCHIVPFAFSNNDANTAITAARYRAITTALVGQPFRNLVRRS